MNYEEALGLATIMHNGQIRKKTGEDYIIHPFAVANKFLTEGFKIVAILHDVIEDTNLTLNNLRERGLDEKLVLVVDVLTHKKNQTYLEYILNVELSEMARLVKIEDLKHNLINPLTKCQKDKYEMALYILEN